MLQATLPESPRWLLLNGADRDDAVKALVRAEGRRAADVTLVEQEVEAMAAGIAEAKADRVDRNGRSVGGGGLELFQESRYYRPLLVGMSLMLFQQVGVHMIGYCWANAHPSFKIICNLDVLYHVHKGLDAHGVCLMAGIVKV